MLRTAIFLGFYFVYWVISICTIVKCYFWKGSLIRLFFSLLIPSLNQTKYTVVDSKFMWSLVNMFCYLSVFFVLLFILYGSEIYLKVKKLKVKVKVLFWRNRDYPPVIIRFNKKKSRAKRNTANLNRNLILPYRKVKSNLQK